jgi:hypothetical protein
MNILFIGPYRQSDAWGETSKGFIKTLLSVEDFSVTARPIFMSDQYSGSVDADILRCESNKKDKYDVLIQHMLPNFMVYDSRFKQVVGITSLETAGCKVWNNNLNLLDKIFVTTEAERSALSNNLQSKTYNIGVAKDKADNNVDKIFNPFTFYAMGGGLESRSGIRDSLSAYCTEFNINDNVKFVLQANDTQKATNLIQQVYSDLGLYSADYYPEIHIVNDPSGLHENCNCFVDCSYSLGFGSENLAALSAGSTPMVLKNSGKDEYINKENGFIVESFEDIVFCPDRPMAGIFTAKETYFKPIVSSIREQMRECFSSKINYLSKSRKCKELAMSVGHEARASKIKEILCS